MTNCGPRDIWSEIQNTATRWRAAGCPDFYRIHFNPDGAQTIGAGPEAAQLSWPLAASPAPTTLPKAKSRESAIHSPQETLT